MLYNSKEYFEMTLLYNMFATACCACRPILHHNILLQILCFNSYSAIHVPMLVVYTIYILTLSHITCP